ncbi:MAG: hypothetical protein ACLFV6_17720 [Spirulinaceae cyanobacterium]
MFSDRAVMRSRLIGAMFIVASVWVKLKARSYRQKGAKIVLSRIQVTKITFIRNKRDRLVACHFAIAPHRFAPFATIESVDLRNLR